MTEHLTFKGIEYEECSGEEAIETGELLKMKINNTELNEKAEKLKSKLSEFDKTQEKLIFAYAHLPEKLRYLANPPKDITKDKYNDVAYLEFCAEMINELEDEDFDTRSDGVLPYDKEVLVNYFWKRYYTIKQTLEEKE